MKKIIFLGLSMTVITACGSNDKEVKAKDAQKVAETKETDKVFNLVTSESIIEWTGEKLLGNTHHGTIEFLEGTIAVENENVTSGGFVADMNTIENMDLPTEGEYNQEKLVGHLKSADFFDVENHPNSSFQITSISKEDDEEGNTHKVSGNFTIRGVAKEISFPAKIEVAEDAVRLTADFFFNRLDWGVSYDEEGIQSFIDGLVKKGKDDFVKNEIGLNITIVAK